MASFAEVFAADRRLAILKLLVENAGELGESVLEKGLGMLGFGAQLTRDLVREDLRLLQDRDGLVIEFYQDRFMIAKITRRGVDAATGKIAIEGVSQPSLGR